jgi:hypothetical protein
VPTNFLLFVDEHQLVGVNRIVFSLPGRAEEQAVFFVKIILAAAVRHDVPLRDN